MGHALVELGGGAVVSRLFQDLHAPDVNLRKAAVALITALAEKHVSNQRWLCQENGLTVGSIRIFAIPHSYQSEYYDKEVGTKSEEGLRSFLESVVSKSMSEGVSITNGIWHNKIATVDPEAVAHELIKEKTPQIPDPLTTLVGFPIVSPTIHRSAAM